MWSLAVRPTGTPPRLMLDMIGQVGPFGLI